MTEFLSLCQVLSEYIEKIVIQWKRRLMFGSVMTSHLNFITEGTVSIEHLSHETL